MKYEKKDNKYFLKESRKYYNHYVQHKNTQTVEYVVEEYFDWFSQNINQHVIEETYIIEHSYTSSGCISTEKKVPSKFKQLSNLYSLEYKYNKNDWQSIPKIKTKIISDLNSFKNLEEQFIDD